MSSASYYKGIADTANISSNIDALINAKATTGSYHLVWPITSDIVNDSTAIQAIIDGYVGRGFTAVQRSDNFSPDEYTCYLAPCVTKVIVIGWA